MSKLYENAQWAVTNQGVVSVKPGAPMEYFIDASRLLETDDGADKLYAWPRQLAEKSWVDFAAFEAAFREGLKIHEDKYPGKVDDELMERSFREAWMQHWKR